MPRNRLWRSPNEGLVHRNDSIIRGSGAISVQAYMYKMIDILIIIHISLVGNVTKNYQVRNKRMEARPFSF
jgi:hypothetical protein